MGRFLWLIPFAAHIGYVMATYVHLPQMVGRTPDDVGVSLPLFFGGWFGVIGLANFLFQIIYLRLPKLKESMLQVPGQAHWLSTDETKAELIRRLRGIVEVALLGLNIFFLAVYQSIYQANTSNPILSFPMSVMILGFMGVPLAMVVIVMTVTMAQLGREGKMRAKKRHLTS